MPGYEFLYGTCGLFQQLRYRRQSGDPMFCPSCNAAAKRVYSMPSVAAMFKTETKARLLDKRSSEDGLFKRAPAQDPASTPKSRRASGRPWQIGY